MTVLALWAPLAHAGEGATWQAMLTLLGAGLAAVFVLAVLDVVTVDEPGDLILPFAAVAVLASLSGTVDELVSDWIGWGFPVLVVMLVALVLAATTTLNLAPTSALTISAVIVAAASTFALHDPIVRAWHPPPDFTVAAELDDLTIRIAVPPDGTTVEPGPVDVVVEVAGGTLGPGFTGLEFVDPEELVGLTLTVVSAASGRSVSMTGDPHEDCAAGCDQATFTVDIPEPGTWTVFVEAKTADARTFTRTASSSGAATARIDLTAE